ncbi:MAG TPA: flagellar motor protein MotB [Alphaproteobacteria bacterium]|nr:flagellar motor protein MotB [Alphaproteobacteria bacterium]
MPAAKGTSSSAPIIIKRIKKGGGGHHGGAWKVAYADFVTAMMAFFLLLWLLNVTTDIERKGIADYFAPASISKSESGAGGVFGGQTITAPGAQINNTSPPGSSKTIPEPDESENNRRESPGSGQPTGPKQDQKDTVTSGNAEAVGAKPQTADDKAAEMQRQKDEEIFKQAEGTLREAIKAVPDLAELEKNLVIDSTPEGLRIQIVDKDGYSLFATGSATLGGRSRQLVNLVGRVISRLPNKISITGHTDNTPFPANSRRTNWQLSTERAQSSFEELVVAGVAPDRINAIVGKADREPLVANDPANSQNRRISIVLLRQAHSGL